MDNSFLHRKKLLLVDDELDLLKMVTDILKDAGFETVLTAASVKEAVMVAKQEKPDSAPPSVPESGGIPGK